MQLPFLTTTPKTRTTKFKATIFASLALSMTMGASLALAQEAPRFDWMPPESFEAGAQVSGDVIIPEIIVIKTPMATADASKFQTKKYELELEKYGIKNDGTDAVATSKGINAALQHAKAIKATYITFPKGEYLIDSANDPIILDLKNVIIDLNGSTIHAQTDGDFEAAAIITVHGADTLRLTNGNLRGDREKNQGATGLLLNGGVNLEIDHLKVYDFSRRGLGSYAYGSMDRAGLLARIVDSVMQTNLTAGGFDENGAAIENAAKTRTIKPYDMTKANGEFEVGYTVGYQGYPHVNGRVYQAYFYDDDMKFISKDRLLQFHKVQLPENARFMQLEFNQPDVNGNAQGLVVRITNFTPPTKVHIHDVVMENNRILGFGMLGGQEWIIENCDFVRNGGASPGYGIDFEDGWELVQHIVFRGNRFKDNLAGDLVVVSGSEYIFEYNQFEKNMSIQSRVHNYTFRNNTMKGNTFFTTRTGVAEIYENTYDGGTLNILFDTKAVADGLYRKPGQTVATPPLLFKHETLKDMKRVTGTYLNFENATLENVIITVGKDTRMVRFINTTSEDSSIVYNANGEKVLHQVSGTKGKLTEKGEGMSRRKALPE